MKRTFDIQLSIQADVWKVFFLLSSWYTRRELAFRTAILYSGLILATAFSGLIAAGVFANLDGSQGIAGWLWLFIIEGSLSFFFGLLAVFVLPDFPERASGAAKWLLAEEERHVAVLRLQRDRVSIADESHSVWYGLKLACSDYRTWIFVSIPSAGMHRRIANRSQVLMLIANHTAYFQLLLPQHRQRPPPRLHNDNPRPHHPTLPPRHLHRLRRGLLQRQKNRTRLAHLRAHVHCSSRLHNLRRNPQHRRPLLRLLPLHLRMLFRQRGRF